VKLGKFNCREIGDSKLPMEDGSICNEVATKPACWDRRLQIRPVLRNSLHTLF